MRILVVDDSHTFRRLLCRELRSLGALEVVEARDGREALAFALRQRFDLILTDWRMPRMDGLDFLKAVRESNATIPIIMVTSVARPIEVLEAIRHGVSDYLIKPFERPALREKLIKWLSRCDGWIPAASTAPLP